MTDAEWVDLESAWNHIESALQPLPSEAVSLDAACGRVLAQSVQVDRDQPAFDRAAMDGFAVHSDDVRSAAPETPVRLRIVGESRPGSGFAAAYAPGTAVRIMTGAPVPHGWDAVVPVEATSGFESEPVSVRASAAPGQHLTRRASERRAGEDLLDPGRVLTAADVGALATVGMTRVQVHRRADVAILATGDELVPPAAVPEQHQIRNSNTPQLHSLIAASARQVHVLGASPDRPADLEQRIAAGLQADLLLITGGISAGRYDFVGGALAAHGVRFRFRQVALQPGKPVAFGVHARGAVLALPGNPVSAFVTGRLFALPALLRLAGAARIRPRWGIALARFEWQRRNPKCLILPGVRDASGAHVDLVPYRGSGDLLAYGRADCQVVLHAGIDRVEPGLPVPVWPL